MSKLKNLLAFKNKIKQFKAVLYYDGLGRYTGELRTIRFLLNEMYKSADWDVSVHYVFYLDEVFFKFKILSECCLKLEILFFSLEYCGESCGEYWKMFDNSRFFRAIVESLYILLDGVSNKLVLSNPLFDYGSDMHQALREYEEYALRSAFMRECEMNVNMKIENN
uniref:Uncharacterized protein n=1 Tax=Halimeda discoidea TaxID=118222 RepID=A0A1C9JB64_9CHLO|nr:hypothetical protein [Halimeda discoidea]